MPRTALFFARRYLFSKGSHSVINIISWVSAVAIGVPVAAMVVLLSVFNGFADLVRAMYSDFDSDIVVRPHTGKTFVIEEFDRQGVLSASGVAGLSFCLEENALAEYDRRQFICSVRGVDSAFTQVVPIEKMISQGKWSLKWGDMDEAVIGNSLAYNLGVSTALGDALWLYAPRRGAFSTLLPMDSYRRQRVIPSGVFTLDNETDGTWILTSLEFAQTLFDYPGRASGAMVRVMPGQKAEKVRDRIRQKVGEGYDVLTQAELHASLYKIMKAEKWAIYFIGVLVLIIASFGIVGSILMLVLDKKDDRETLSVLGGTKEFLRKIFVAEGVFISMLGAGVGLLLGLLFSLGQQHFGWIKIPAETFLIDAYPVVVKGWDVVLIVVTFAAVNYLIARATVNRAIR